MKQYLSLLCAVLALCCLLMGCAADKAPETTQPAPAEPTGLYIQYQDAKLAVGIPFADVKDALGAEARPAEVILPCDGSDAYKDTMHFYGHLAVTENIDGIITNIEISDFYEGEGDPTFMGTIRLGATQEEAVKALGEPDNYPLEEDDYSLTYRKDNICTMVFLDPETDKQTVSGISMILENSGF